MPRDKTHPTGALARSISLRHTTCLFGLLAFPALLGAQTLPTGAWPGHLEFPDGDSVGVTFTVDREKGTTRIDVASANGTNWGLGSINEKKGRIAFTWAIDSPTPMQCELSHRSDRSWDGRCDDTVRGTDGKFLRLLVALRRAE